MAKFTLEARTQIFAANGRFPSGTTVSINLPAPATPATLFTNPNYKMQILSQFRNQGIDINPNQIASGYFKVIDVKP